MVSFLENLIQTIKNKTSIRRTESNLSEDGGTLFKSASENEVRTLREEFGLRPLKVTRGERKRREE